MTHRTLRTIISVVVGVALAALIAYGQIKNQAAAPQAGIAGTPIGGSFAGLVDGHGKTVTDDTFKGRYQLVFFGFTHCPAICPTALQKVKAALKDLSADEQAQIAPIFVSVDPERDTPEAIGQYTALFSPAITGLTGTPAAIDKVKAEWKVYASKVQTSDMPEYTVDHSAFLYFRGPDGLLIDLFETTDTPVKITQSLKAALKK